MLKEIVDAESRVFVSFQTTAFEFFCVGGAPYVPKLVPLYHWLLEEVVVGVAGEGDGDAGSVFEPCGVVVTGIVAVESLERIPCQQLRHVVAEDVGQ